MKNEKIVSFPHLGNYYIPFSFLLSKVSNVKIKRTPPITNKTIELGTKYSPDFVCIPFKYNLGNYIEALDNGANVLIQAGGGCRYGFYAEVQEKILRDLGYDFEFISLTKKSEFMPIFLYKQLKRLNPKLGIFKYIYYVLLTFYMIYLMDKTDHFIRGNIGFEKSQGDFEKNLNNMLKDFSNTTGFFSITKKYLYYKKIFKNIPIEKKTNCLKVGIIGELYTSMEPFATFFLEKELASMNIEIKRFTNVSYLLVFKRFKVKKLLKSIPKYCKYTIGADGMDNVARCKILIDEGYDGIIHIKPFGCTPEVGAMPIISRICQDNEMPIIYFSFDSNTSEVGIKTRLEAFKDMLMMKKEK